MRDGIHKHWNKIIIHRIDTCPVPLLLLHRFLDTFLQSKLNNSAPPQHNLSKLKRKIESRLDLGLSLYSPFFYKNELKSIQENFVKLFLSLSLLFRKPISRQKKTMNTILGKAWQECTLLADIMFAQAFVPLHHPSALSFSTSMWSSLRFASTCLLTVPQSVHTMLNLKLLPHVQGKAWDDVELRVCVRAEGSEQSSRRLSEELELMRFKEDRWQVTVIHSRPTLPCLSLHVRWNSVTLINSLSLCFLGVKLCFVCFVLTYCLFGFQVFEKPAALIHRQEIRRLEYYQAAYEWNVACDVACAWSILYL